jgi:hypothetical protein
MPTGIPTSDELKLDIMELIEKGMPERQIAKDLNTSQSTVHRVKKEFYGKDIRSMDKVIAGDKHNGTLTAVGPNHYVGTCLVHGKMKKRHFNICGSKDAIDAWEEWKSSLITPKPVAVTNEIKIEEPVMTNTTNAEAPKNSDIYILAVGTPKIAAFFDNEEKAREAMHIANKALEFAGVDIRYSVIPAKVEIQNY